MTTELDFYFDFGSPASFLGYKRLLQLEKQYPLTIHYKPMLLGAVFKATQNTSPVTVPAKGAYMLKFDLPRFSKRYQVDFKLNPFFPINTLKLMRGAHAAVQLNCFSAYCETIFNAVWQQGLNMADAEVIIAALNAAQLNGAEILNLAETVEIKQALANLTDEAIQRGIFGAPTFFIGDDMFFGQDRLDFIEEYLRAKKFN